MGPPCLPAHGTRSFAVTGRLAATAVLAALVLCGCMRPATAGDPPTAFVHIHSITPNAVPFGNDSTLGAHLTAALCSAAANGEGDTCFDGIASYSLKATVPTAHCKVGSTPLCCPVAAGQKSCIVAGVL
jgi:hypothetical protein